jgi:hypothetical protein
MWLTASASDLSHLFRFLLVAAERDAAPAFAFKAALEARPSGRVLSMGNVKSRT